MQEVVRQNGIPAEVLDRMTAAIGDFDNQITNPPVTNYFAQGDEEAGLSGLYGRELFIPAGSIMAGKVHKFEHISVLIQGYLEIASPEGVIRVRAPYVCVTKPGIQRIVYAYEDSIFLTVHGTNETDVQKIEQTVVADNHQKYLEYVNERRLLKEEL